MCLVKVVCFDPRNTPFDAKHDLMTLPFYVPPLVLSETGEYVLGEKQLAFVCFRGTDCSAESDGRNGA